LHLWHPPVLPKLAQKITPTFYKNRLIPFPYLSILPQYGSGGLGLSLAQEEGNKTKKGALTLCDSISLDQKCGRKLPDRIFGV
jgi:hypothetical protein